MIKKILASMLLLTTPILAQASEGINFGSLEDLNAKCRLNRCNVKKAHSSSSSSSSESSFCSESSFSSCESSCFQDCSCCSDDCDLFQAAYFYLIDDQTVIEDGAVIWDPARFTVKSSFIFVNDDPMRNSEIIVHEPGVYLITYSVSAENEGDDLLVSDDTVTFELHLNKARIAGTKYRVFTQPAGGAGTVDVQQINGQVLAYIPADGRVEVINKTGVTVDLTANRGALPPTTNHYSVVASIQFQKIADLLR